MPTLYDRKLLNSPTVTLSFNDPLGGLLKPSQVELHFSNDDHFFDGVNLRGERITYNHFDTLTNDTWEGLTGTVVSQEWRVGRVILHTMAHDLSAFQTLLPKEIVTAATFPTADPQQGLGRPIPIIFGTAASTNKVNDAWELPWVGDSAGAYDYLVGRGTFTNVSVYRDTVGDKLFLVPGAEYTVNTSAYSGFTVIRFALRQRSFGGGFHRIFAAADVSGGSRNFATNIQSLLSNSTWGLGLSVNAASFTTAAADLDAIGSYYCDGAITEQREAQDYLRQLMMVRGMMLTQNSDGEYVLTVDTPASTIKGLFGHGLGQAANGVAEDGFEGLETTPMSDAIKTLVMDYRIDRWTGKPVLATSPRSIFSYGEERRIENQFIRAPVTADKTTCYIANRHIYGDERVTFRAGQRARKLRPGEIIRYQSMQPVFDAYYSCRDITRELTQSRIYAVGWNAGIYTYTAGTLPGEPAASTDTDWSRSTPTVASSLSVASSGVETTDQGVKAAYMVLQYTVPDESWASTVVRYTKDGETIWTTLPGENGSGVKQTKITGLVGSQVYDLRVTRQNSMNATLTADADLPNQTAPGDTTAPSAPSAISVRQAGGKVVEIDLTFTAPSDWGRVDLYRHTSNSSGSATLIATGKKKRFHDQNVSYGTTYYYWAKVVDQSGNASGFSPSSSHSITIAKVVTGDVGTGEIATGNVAANAITASGVYVNDSSASITGSESEIGTITISTDGGALEIYGKAHVTIASDGTPGSTCSVIVRIRKDSTSGSVLDLAALAVGDESNGIAAAISLTGYDASPAASQTYKLTAIRDLGNSTCTGLYRRLTPVNFKK